MLSVIRSRVAVSVVRSALRSAPRAALPQSALFTTSSSLNSSRTFTPSLATTFKRSFSDEMGGAPKREVGTVKWFDASKGFGFIVRDNGADLFVHYSAIRGTGYRTIEEGQKVEFTVGQGTKGPTAVDVTLKK